MILLLDIGNTNTHLGLANSRRVVKQATVPTAAWFDGDAKKSVTRFVGRAPVEGAALCSVVPRATPLARRAIKEAWRLPCLQLTPATLRGVGIAYPKPETIGPDRIPQPLAVGAPVWAPAAPRQGGGGEPPFWRAVGGRGFWHSGYLRRRGPCGQLRRRDHCARALGHDGLSSREDGAAAAHQNPRNQNRRGQKHRGSDAGWGGARLPRTHSRDSAGIETGVKGKKSARCRHRRLRPAHRLKAAGN